MNNDEALCEVIARQQREIASLEEEHRFDAEKVERLEDDFRELSKKAIKALDERDAAITASKIDQGRLENLREANVVLENLAISRLAEISTLKDRYSSALMDLENAHDERDRATAAYQDAVDTYDALVASNKRLSVTIREIRAMVSETV